MELERKRRDYCKNVCKAWCCKYLVFEQDKITDVLLFSLRGIKIDPNNGKLIIAMRCKWLNNHNQCRMYLYRPKDCVAYECEELKKIT